MYLLCCVTDIYSPLFSNKSFLIQFSCVFWWRRKQKKKTTFVFGDRNIIKTAKLHFCHTFLYFFVSVNSQMSLTSLVLVQLELSRGFRELFPSVQNNPTAAAAGLLIGEWVLFGELMNQIFISVIIVSSVQLKYFHSICLMTSL